MPTATAIEPTAPATHRVAVQRAPKTPISQALFRADQKHLNALLGEYENARSGPEQWRLEERICAELRAYPPTAK